MHSHFQILLRGYKGLWKIWEGVLYYHVLLHFYVTIFQSLLRGYMRVLWFDFNSWINKKYNWLGNAKTVGTSEFFFMLFNWPESVIELQMLKLELRVQVTVALFRIEPAKGLHARVQHRRSQSGQNFSSWKQKSYLVVIYSLIITTSQGTRSTNLIKNYV